MNPLDDQAGRIVAWVESDCEVFKKSMPAEDGSYRKLFRESADDRQDVRHYLQLDVVVINFTECSSYDASKDIFAPSLEI